ncbi:MAG: TIM barrel protein [Christensenellales bacterium]
MKDALFGPAGNPDSFYKQGYNATSQIPAWLRELGLSAYEYPCGRGVRIRQETAEQIGMEAEKNGTVLSLHAPYFINLAVEEEEKILKNIAYFREAAQAAKWMGAKRVVFHPGSSKNGSKQALSQAKKNLQRILETLNKEGLLDMTFCPETMGKRNQLGSLEEVLDLCATFGELVPAIDFGHLHARGQGAIQGEADYAAILDTLAGALEGDRLKKIHIHFSRIEFTAGGERRHWTFADKQFGPDFMPLMELLARRELTPVVICESRGTMAEDALAMQQAYYLAKNRL